MRCFFYRNFKNDYISNEMFAYAPSCRRAPEDSSVQVNNRAPFVHTPRERKGRSKTTGAFRSYSDGNRAWAIWFGFTQHSTERKKETKMGSLKSCVFSAWVSFLIDCTNKLAHRWTKARKFAEVFRLFCPISSINWVNSWPVLSRVFAKER